MRCPNRCWSIREQYPEVPISATEVHSLWVHNRDHKGVSDIAGGCLVKEKDASR
jgi:hypothetical protein